MLTSHSTAIIAANAILLALAVIAVFLRFLVRWRFSQRVGKDDWCILAALAFAAGLGLLLIIGVPVAHLGGLTEELMSSDNMATFLKFAFAWQFLYTFAVTSVKLSFLFFYGRFFRDDPFPRLQTIMIGLVLGWFTVFLFTTIFQAWPMYCNWSDCKMTMDYPAMYVAMATTAIALDVGIFLLPLFMLRRLSLTPGKQRALALIFGLGVFCVVASTIRVVYAVIFMIAIRRQDGNFSAIIGSSSVNVGMWSGIEALASTLCACLPCFGPYISRASFFRRMVESSPGKLPQYDSTGIYVGDTLVANEKLQNQPWPSRVFCWPGSGMRSKRDKLPKRSYYSSHWHGSRKQPVVAATADTKKAGSSSEQILSPHAFCPDTSIKRPVPTRRERLEPAIELGIVSLRTTGSDDGGGPLAVNQATDPRLTHSVDLV